MILKNNFIYIIKYIIIFKKYYVKTKIYIKLIFQNTNLIFFLDLMFLGMLIPTSVKEECYFMYKKLSW